MEYIKQATRAHELLAMFTLKKRLKTIEKELIKNSDSEHKGWCYHMLTKVSRSFALVIQELGSELKDAVCIFYLVLRGLDTIEDDPEFPKEQKLPQLLSFHEKLYQKGWTFASCGKKDERILLENFDRVIEVFGELKKEYQLVIADITKEMGLGMAKFVSEKRVESLKDWDEYCHYVAGLVGEGLSRLFAHSGLEDKTWFLGAEKESNSMGLFLQKTNIIRDYLEDLLDQRIFWPKEVWSKYTDDLALLKEPSHRPAALQCLNELVTNALEHVDDCLTYMAKVRTSHNFNFCAIPQVMAIANLSLCYNNPEVYSGRVKLRRGETARMIVEMNGMTSVYKHFYDFAYVIKRKIPKDDPNAKRTAELTDHIIKVCKDKLPPSAFTKFSKKDVLVAAVALVALAAYLFARTSDELFVPKL